MKALFFLLSIFPLSIFCQEFSFPIFFEDAKGNKDTIVLGYDQSATDAIDTLFGEKDIKNAPWDTVFEARVTDAYSYSLLYYSKKQILYKDCNKNKRLEATAIIVYCKYYPFVIRWDSSLFNIPCREKSFLTEWIPGGWFDAGYKPIYWLKNFDSIKYINPPYAFKDSLFEIYFAFSTIAEFGMTVRNKDALSSKIKYNNIINELLIIETEDKIITEIIDITGKILMSTACKSISLSNFASGMYIIKIYCDDKIILVDKVIKQ